MTSSIGYTYLHFRGIHSTAAQMMVGESTAKALSLAWIDAPDSYTSCVAF